MHIRKTGFVLLTLICIGLPCCVAQQSADAQPQNSAASQSTKPKAVDDQESHERVLGLAPLFNVTDEAHARPLTPRQKWRLFYRETYDPFEFFAAGFDAGLEQATDGFHEYGQGAAGYGKRFGAALADESLGNFFGGFALPVLLHDDPRYFRRGSGSYKGRLLHALGSTVIARRDNGTHHANYSNLLGNIAACAIGNAYYPRSDRGIGTTFSRAATVTAYGAIGTTFSEFWPDIQRRIFKRHEKIPPIPTQDSK